MENYIDNVDYTDTKLLKKILNEYRSLQSIGENGIEWARDLAIDIKQIILDRNIITHEEYICILENVINKHSHNETAKIIGRSTMYIHLRNKSALIKIGKALEAKNG